MASKGSMKGFMGFFKHHPFGADSSESLPVFNGDKKDDWNNPIGVELSIRSSGGHFDFNGIGGCSGIEIPDVSDHGWPVPNVIGVVRRPTR